MSNHWDLHCVTCDDHARGLIWMNHGENELRLLCSLLPLVIALDDARAAINHAIDGHRTPGLYGWTMELELRFASMGDNRPTVRALADWARKHVGHDVRPRSEYGDIDGQCNRHWLCGLCATRHLCTKVLGHEGEHGRA